MRAQILRMVRWVVWVAALVVVSQGAAAFAAGTPAGAVKVGVVWDADDRLFWQAVELAVREINAGGGVLGRNLEIVRRDDRQDVTSGMAVAQTLVDDAEVSAVIGHRRSYVAVPAAGIYDKGGLPYLAFSATAPELTERGYGRVYRTVPSDIENARQLAQYAAALGYRRVAIYYSPDAYGRGLANAFEDAGHALGMEVVDRVAYFGDVIEARNLIRRWQAFGYDSLFVADVMPRAGEFVEVVREAGAMVRIFGGDGLANAQLLELEPEKTEGIVVISHFNAEAPAPATQGFVRAYRDAYGEDPEQWGALAYDTLKLVAAAIERAGSPAPDRVASALHAVAAWSGATGTITFDPSGEVVGKAVHLAQVQSGRFVQLDVSGIARGL